MVQSWFKFNSYPLTTLGILLFLILGSMAFSALYGYFRLQVQTEAVIDRWKVVKKSSSSYPIRGYYHFEFQGKSYQTFSFLPPPHNLNRPSAEKAISRFEKKSLRVWLDPRNPTVSSLEKTFPIKRIIYAFLTLGVTLYFWLVETNSKIRNPTN